jgi:hypothetical protein
MTVASKFVLSCGESLDSLVGSHHWALVSGFAGSTFSSAMHFTLECLSLFVGDLHGALLHIAIGIATFQGTWVSGLGNRFFRFGLLLAALGGFAFIIRRLLALRKHREGDDSTENDRDD